MCLVLEYVGSAGKGDVVEHRRGEGGKGVGVYFEGIAFRRIGIGFRF